MTAAWPTIVITFGALLLASFLIALTRIDRAWRSHRWSCCHCRRRWHGRDTRCQSCGGRGNRNPLPVKRTPTHDWQGRLDTGPIPVVPEQRTGRHEQRQEAER